MLKLYFLLYYEFLKIGIFAIGGGYAALPFLYFIQSKYNWFSVEELTNMIAVSNITPGPIGINMATYTGYTTAGVIGSLICTSAIVSAPFIFLITIMKIYDKFKSCSAVNAVFNGLRPASCALLSAIGFQLLYKTCVTQNPFVINYKAVILFVILMIPFSFMKKQPLIAIVAGALGGIILNRF